MGRPIKVGTRGPGRNVLPGRGWLRNRKFVEASIHITEAADPPPTAAGCSGIATSGQATERFGGKAEVVGTGWSGSERVFSGGNGIIYAIERFVEASVHITKGHIPAHGGRLLVPPMSATPTARSDGRARRR